MPKLFKLKNNKGFTLVEAVVSILILGIALGVLLASFMMGRMSVVVAKHRIEAMNHARAAMEQYINKQTTYILPDGDIKSLGGSCPAPNVTLDYSGYSGLSKIVVTISWNEQSLGTDRPVSEQLVTLLIQ